jgi:SAM-dependent methyltransferase
VKLAEGVCPFCGGTALRRFSAIPSDERTGERLLLVECRTCAFAWQWPPRRDLDKSVAHASSRYVEPQDNAYYDPATRAKVAREQLGFIRELTGAPTRLLDVGAGDGAFVMEAARQGWSAVGVDPAAPVCRDDNPRFVRGLLSDLPPEERFDVITLWDVIEHLDSPMDVLAAATKLLSPGGHLVIETGNYQSADRIAAGQSWWCYADDHRWYFAPPIVMGMLSRLGLARISLANRVLRPAWRGERSPKPRVGGVVRNILKRPDHSAEELRRFARLHRASRDWPAWNRLGIFAVAGQKPQN